MQFKIYNLQKMEGKEKSGRRYQYFKFITDTMEKTAYITVLPNSPQACQAWLEAYEVMAKALDGQYLLAEGELGSFHEVENQAGTGTYFENSKPSEINLFGTPQLMGTPKYEYVKIISSSAQEMADNNAVISNSGLAAAKEARATAKADAAARGEAPAPRRRLRTNIR